MNSQDIINYWYADRLQSHWFSSNPELDTEIRQKFEPLWNRANAGELDAWLYSPDTCLALIIVLDQLPLNMFRGTARAFESESKAVKAAHHAVDSGFDKQLDIDRLIFLFMPFMHSERLEDQDLAVELYNKYHLTDNAKFAEHHRSIVRQFGRFPHRNKLLGRKSTQQELSYLNTKNAFRG